MNVFREFQNLVVQTIDGLSRSGEMPAGLDLARVTVEPPREAAHGDLATNAAMVLAKPAGMKPRDLADRIAAPLRAAPHVTEVQVAGPGFINLRVSDDYWRERLRDVLRAGRAYGDSAVGAGQRVNVEYVSANPTGPLHAAHARGAVVGDALAALLKKAGYEVTKEYYINDAGAQVDVLARSTFLRYREALGEAIAEIPSGLYPGEYLKDVGHALAERDGPKWLDRPEEEWLPNFRAFAVERMLADIQQDLHRLGVRQDVFTSERSLIDSGAVDAAIGVLDQRGLLYTGVLEPPKGKTPDDWEPRPQTLFRATEFGDDVDRPIRKSDGSWTYFASDIAYHFDKFRRGTATMIDVWGADHGGYVKRMQAAVTAVTGGQGALDVKICQLVHMLDRGVPVRMSKRAGTFITLSDVLDRVGPDVVRFIMLTRRNDQTLEFDYSAVTEQSKDNPVFYVQYAHARCSSVLRHAAEQYPDWDLTGLSLSDAPLHRLTGTEELELIKKLASWPRTIEAAAEAHEPHRLTFFLYEIAAIFHSLWTKGRDDTTLRFLIDSDRELTLARLAFVKAVATVIASGLDVIGVVPLEEMR